MASRSPSKNHYGDDVASKRGIEELLVNPGTFKQGKEKKKNCSIFFFNLLIYSTNLVRVWYTGRRHFNSDAKASKLQKRKFTISLKVKNSHGDVKEERAVSCQARVCTALIEAVKCK